MRYLVSQQRSEGLKTKLSMTLLKKQILDFQERNILWNFPCPVDSVYGKGVCVCDRVSMEGNLQTLMCMATCVTIYKARVTMISPRVI